MRGRRWIVAGGAAAMVIAIVVVATCGEDRGRAPTPIGGAGSTLATPRTPIAAVRRDAGALPKPPAGGLRLEGQVIDERDQPVAGATVRFYNFEPETLTAEDGSFVFEHLAAHDNYQVTASKGEDTYCEMVRATLSETSAPVILRLRPAATAVVHVVDADGGKPIAGARLGTRVTDANGEVRVRGLVPGGNNIVIIGIDADGYESTRVKISNLDLANTADNVFRVELQRGAPVRGTVVGPNGEPIVDAWVNARGRARSETQTDAAGAWTLTLAAGAQELVASAPGFIDSAVIALDTDGVHARDGVSFRLQAAPARPKPTTFVGTVVDEAGSVVAGAEVSVETDAGKASELSDAQGRFRVDVSAARWLTLSAKKGDRASPSSTVDLYETDVKLVIARSTIAGIVVDRRGNPAPGVRVHLRSVMSDAAAVSDAKGRFELVGLEPGDHTLVVAHDDEQYAGWPEGVVASTGDRNVRLVFTDVGTIAGRVMLDGKPVPYFGVYLPEADQTYDRPFIVRAPDGRFVLKGVLAGTWTVVLAGPSFGRKTIKNVVVTETGETELGDIAVDRGRTVRGRVTDTSGAGVGGATVTIHDADSPRDALTRALQGTGVATTDAAGAYRITSLAPPIWGGGNPRRIVATHPTRGVSIERVLPDDATEANLVLVKPGGIDGRLEGVETGVFCHRVDDPGFLYTTSPDAAGRFRFDNLPPGAYRLRPNAVTAVTATVTVVSGQRTKLVLAVPTERVELQIVAACSKQFMIWTDDGVDEVAQQSCAYPVFSAVPPGVYRICVDDQKRCMAATVQPAPAKQTITVR